MAKKNGNAKVESIRHKDKRKNIPTKELRDFVADEELAPKTMLYPRDPSLDPQLVWKGKDEQDREDLAVPIVPIYIQEKIHPQAIIDALPRIEKSSDKQINLFADFNGGPVDFDKKVDFYHHEQNWSNRLILGDSLLVMTSMAEKEGLKGKVQTIYIDPPYGIKFGSNWQVSTRKRDVKDGKAEDATRQPEQVRAFRDTWKLGIHSYLAYLRDRLVVGRDLLTETGSIFVQIGDENVHLVRCLLDEVFGSENFIAQIAFRTTAARAAGFIDSICDNLLWYGKSREITKYRPILVNRSSETESNYDWIDEGKQIRQLDARELWIPQEVLGGRKYALGDCTSQGYTNSGDFPLQVDGQIFRPSSTRHWATTSDGLAKAKAAGRLQVKGPNVFYRRSLLSKIGFLISKSISY
jgi:adenine-specific DNA-methyltransferase